MRKGVEDGDEPVHAFEREGRDRGNVARREKGALQEEEKKDGNAKIGERKWSILMKFVPFVGIGELRGDGGYCICCRLWGRRWRRWRSLFFIEEGVNVVFETDPRDKSDAKGKVEKAFVGDGKDDEGRGKGEKDYDKPVEIVIVGLYAVEKGY